MTNDRFDYSVSPFWNTGNFRYEVMDYGHGHVVFSGVATSRVAAQDAAKKKMNEIIASLSR